MSRTFKDKPYKLIMKEASDAGYDSRYCVDVNGYAYSKHRVIKHLPLRRYTDWRWIEAGWWNTDYGNENNVKTALRRAVIDYNNDCLDDDWDDASVYQRRRRWVSF